MKTNQEIIKEYGKSDTDTGSAEVQVALLSKRIDHLTDHLKTHKKDEVRARSKKKCCLRRLAWSPPPTGHIRRPPCPSERESSTSCDKVENEAVAR